MKIVTTVLSMVFGALMLVMGFNKFFHFASIPDMPQEAMDIMAGFTGVCWLMPLVGTVEVLSGGLMLLPRLRNIGAVMIFPVIVGILLFNVFHNPEGIPMAAVLIFINLWLLGSNKEKLSNLF